ncbi:GDSL esterase/lipase [Striga asiatica]|uniref:GDSL esterase/lipase n=1 Tax=Striga asiatica TaxID=4170 RepID=A0A5A7Q9H0_STRAF|nr:GDSL esterase/lipase [Striga asiatica]
MAMWLDLNARGGYALDHGSHRLDCLLPSPPKANLIRALRAHTSRTARGNLGMFAVVKCGPAPAMRNPKSETMEIVKNALFLVSAGTNDFVVNYFTVPIRRNNYTISEYTSFILQEARQGLVDQGATRIGVVGLPPMGCLPIELQPSGSRIAYVDIFGPLEEMTLGNTYDFEEVSKGCCGTGMLEASYMCNSKSVVCEDVNEYVFWDAIHPTEKTYFLLFQEVRPLIDSLVKE